MAENNRTIREASNGGTEDGSGPIFEMGTQTILGKDWPVYFCGFGDGTASPTLVSSANPLPVAVEGGVTIEGDVIVDAVTVDNFPAVQAVSQSGAWTVAVSNFPATQAVSGPFLTDAQLRATPVPVEDLPNVNDANNSTASGGQSLAAFGGVAYTPPAIGGAPPIVSSPDTYAGSLTEIGLKYVGFMVAPTATVVGQGYSEFYRFNGTSFNYLQTTLFAGGGIFQSPPGATHYRIVFQNLSPTSNLFTLQTTLLRRPMAPFMFPIGAPIDPSFLAWLGIVSIQGRQPDSDFDSVRTPGSIPEFTTQTPLGAGATFAPVITPGVLSGRDLLGQPGPGYDTTGFVSVAVIVKASHASATNGIIIEFSNDAFATISASITFTYTANDIEKSRRFTLPANIGEQVRIRYVNGGTAQTSFDLRTEMTTTAVQPMTDDIGRGTLLVSPGLRLSQTFKRTRVELPLNSLAADTLLHTVTAGKRLYIVGITVFIRNDSITSAGVIVIRDSLTAGAGTIKLPMSVSAATNQGASQVTVSPSNLEPIEFATGIFADFGAGTLTVSGLLIGYEEDV